MGDDLGAIAFLPGRQAADVIDMAMSGDDMPDGSRLQAQRSDIVLDSVDPIANARIDHHQLGPGIHKIDECVLRCRKA